jgi:cell wall-associated NlpC family hydrolase
MKTLVEYAKSFIGKPYLWAGEGPTGFDCSGLVQEILRSVGEDPSGDQTAQGLFNYFRENGTILQRMKPCALIFYGKSSRQITHVAFGIDNFRIVEAGGGGSSTVNVDVADKQGAMIRIRPHNHRTDMVAIFMPDYINCQKEF